MTPEEAESIFYEFGDVLSNQRLTTPEKFGPNLARTSRVGLRTAILMWVAKQKFEGVDILYRREMPNGQRAAVLELAQNLWPFTSLFGAVQTDFQHPNHERKAATQPDDMTLL